MHFCLDYSKLERACSEANKPFQDCKYVVAMMHCRVSRLKPCSRWCNICFPGEEKTVDSDIRVIVQAIVESYKQTTNNFEATFALLQSNLPDFKFISTELVWTVMPNRYWTELAIVDWHQHKNVRRDRKHGRTSWPTKWVQFTFHCWEQPHREWYRRQLC